MTTKFAQGFWRLADPKISLASAASMLLGASAAAVAGPLDLGWLAVTVLGIFAVEVAKNASGEVFDWDSGTDLRIRAEDRSPFSGGKRVLVDGLLTRGQTWGIAAGGYLVALLAGLAIVRWREARRPVARRDRAGAGLLLPRPAAPPELPGTRRVRGRGGVRSTDLRGHLSRAAREHPDLVVLISLPARPPDRRIPLDQRIPGLRRRRDVRQAHAGGAPGPPRGGMGVRGARGTLRGW